MKDSEGIIRSELHGELPFQFKENFSDVEFTPEDIKEEVEFTVVTVRLHIPRRAPCTGGAHLSPGSDLSLRLQLKSGKQAVRIQRVKEPLLLTFCPTNTTMDKDLRPPNLDQSGLKVLGKTILPTDFGPNIRLDTELYEGIVTQTIIEPKVRSHP